ncbi:prephenate dehydratase [Patescibacteria group bacterium]|jgi:prephenate dehydratase|nr:prephenate dehydratase [Patescibacteria group bacterium]
MAQTIAFQGSPGAYSHLALASCFPESDPLPCGSFEAVFSALASGAAERAFIPVENSIAGRVADIHHLLPRSRVTIIGEHFQPIHHQLLVVPGTTLEEVAEVHSHVHALGQCRAFIKQHGLTAVVHADTAGAAKDVANWQEPSKAAIASTLAAELYGLEPLVANIEDSTHNTTRFLVLSPEEVAWPEPEAHVITTIFFTLRSVPAALYKAIGGFATNGINLTKIESYLTGERFSVAQFYIDVEGHPDTPAMQHALEELNFFSSEVRIMGVYPASTFRE